MDLLNMSSAAVNKTGQMNVDAACIFLQKATMLIDSKFDVSYFGGLNIFIMYSIM